MRQFWLPWLALNSIWVAIAYHIAAVDGFSFAMGVLVMGLNVAGMVFLAARMIKNQVQSLTLFTLLGLKFAAVLLVIYWLPKIFLIDSLWLGMGVFTVAISAACVSVPLVSKYHR